MACSLQKLFAVGEEFEDEDFLSAVEDTENQLAGSLPINAECLRPVSSRPQAMVQAQSSRWLSSHLTAPSENSGLPALGLRIPTSSLSRPIRDPHSTESATLKPVSTSSSWLGNQRRLTLTEVPREATRPQSLGPCPLSTLKIQQQVVGGHEGPEQDEFDEVLASMELEGPGTELDIGVSRETPRIPPTCQGEGLVLAKKARVAELSRSCVKVSTLATHSSHEGLPSGYGQPLDPVVRVRTPQHHLRSCAPGNLPVPTASAVPSRQYHWSVCAKGFPLQTLQPFQTVRGPVQCSPQGRFSCQPLQSPGGCLSGRPRFPGPRTLSSACSAPSRARSGFCPRGLLEPQSPGAFVEPPASTLKGPHSSLAPQAAKQAPIVTNHLVQLVTAASRPPQPPTRTTTQIKARRFPGPAGLLPHQHSGRNLEEIMVSTPQTPTHGALAKFQTEVVPSSQASVEEDFGRGPWLTMKSSLGLDERDPTSFLCTYSIIMVLRKCWAQAGEGGYEYISVFIGPLVSEAALKQLPRNKVPNMAVMIKSLTRSTVDASVVFKDPTGEMQGTVHRVLLEMRQNELKPGSVLLLKQVGVFSPSLRNHYLNVTPNNLVCIYSPDSGDGNLKPSSPFLRDPGSFQGSLQHAMDVTSEEDLGTARDPEAGMSSKAELSETDDLDGLLSELPEDFFTGTSSHKRPKAGQPP